MKSTHIREAPVSKTSSVPFHTNFEASLPPTHTEVPKTKYSSFCVSFGPWSSSHSTFIPHSPNIQFN